LISVDELRAAGALDVPPEWRKSLSAGCAKPAERHLFSDLADDEESDHHADAELSAEDEELLETDADADDSADEAG
jgi:hypothetical protein